MDVSKFKVVTKDATIPGFRKGKAPQTVVARTIGSSTERSQLAFLHKVFSAYFPDIDAETIQPTELQMTEENTPGIMAAYEANLSPMEYYWADFMAASDQQSEPYIIEVGDYCK